jgi:superfamily II DNA or RNA helicase
MRTYGTISCKNDEWTIEAEAHVVIRLKRIFGQLSSGATKLTIRSRPDVAVDLLWVLERYPLEISDADKALLTRQTVFHVERSERFVKLLTGGWEPQAFKLKLPPRDYQRVSADLALNSTGLLIADAVGVGKTVQAICMFTEPRTLPALVVTLTHLPKQWCKEIARFAPRLRTHILKKAKPYPLPECDVIVTNYHKLAGWAPAFAGKIVTVVFDEVQELRHESTARYEAAQAIANEAKWRVGLSATPIHNYGDEFFNVLNILRPGELGTRAEFLQEWCGASNMNGGAAIKDARAFGSFLRDQGMMIRRTREDVGRELPALTIVPHTVESGDIFEHLEGATDLARFILSRVGSGMDQMQARGDLDWKLRQATGIAKAPYVAAFVRMLVESGERVLLYGWHHACFERGTLVRMFDGSLKLVESVDVGDVLMGPDSKARTVKKLVRGHGKMWRVIPTKGAPWVCSDRHLLSLRCKARNRRPVTTIAAGDFAAMGERARRDLTLYRAAAIAFSPQPACVEPWLLGYWLGDGDKNLRGGPSVSVATADIEVRSELERVAARNGLRLRVHKTKSERCEQVVFTAGRGYGKGRNSLLAAFQALHLHRNKHVPTVYKTASVQERRELLAGVLDADGHVHQGSGAGSATLDLRDERLARDVADVARSLGIAAYVTPKRIAEGSVSGFGGRSTWRYCVNMSGDLTTIPTRIERKRAPIRKNRKDVLNVGLRLEPLPDDDFFGFEVDGDHLFLLADYTVVHNCYDIWIEKLAGIEIRRFTGEESGPQKEKAKRDFESGEARVLIMSLRAGAGLDGLQEVCSTVVFGELDWSPSVHEQATGRVFRDGQKSPVLAYYLVSEEGSDPVIESTLGVKRGQLEGVRSPNAELEIGATLKSDGVLELARQVLRSAGIKEPKPGEAPIAVAAGSQAAAE